MNSGRLHNQRLLLEGLLEYWIVQAGMKQSKRSPSAIIQLRPSVLEQRVLVDHAQCGRVAALLRKSAIPQPQEEIGRPRLNARELGNFYLLLVSICHQTSPRGRGALEGTVDGMRYRGWDYLSAKIAGAAHQRRSILEPKTWSRMTAQDLVQLLSDEEMGDRISDPEGRARLVRDLGQSMLDSKWTSFDDLYTESNGHIDGPNGLLHLLKAFDAYRDPINKKSYFLLALMQYAGVWAYKDPEKLGPPVDYHEIRGHLRLGTVVVTDPVLHERLLSQSVVQEPDDLAIRGAVRDAIVSIAGSSGENSTPIVLHYLFWNVFRSCCTHQLPHCDACPPDCKLPDRYVPLARVGGTRRCPFASVCVSRTLTTRLQEHIFETDYY